MADAEGPGLSKELESLVQLLVLTVLPHTHLSGVTDNGEVMDREELEEETGLCIEPGTSVCLNSRSAQRFPLDVSFETRSENLSPTKIEGMFLESPSRKCFEHTRASFAMSSSDK